MKKITLVIIALMMFICMGCTDTAKRDDVPVPRNSDQNNELHDLKYQIISGDDENIINIHMVNKTNGDIVLNYTSGQRYDYYLIQDDEIVYTWSDGMMFTQALQDKVLKPGEYEEYSIKLDELDVEEGEYILEFFSTAQQASELPHLKLMVNR